MDLWWVIYSRSPFQYLTDDSSVLKASPVVQVCQSELNLITQ